MNFKKPPGDRGLFFGSRFGDCPSQVRRSLKQTALGTNDPGAYETKKGDEDHGPGNRAVEPPCEKEAAKGIDDGQGDRAQKDCGHAGEEKGCGYGGENKHGYNQDDTHCLKGRDDREGKQKHQPEVDEVDAKPEGFCEGDVKTAHQQLPVENG